MCRVWRWPPRCLDVCDKLSLNLASIPQLGVLMEGHMQVKGKVDSCSIPQLSPALSYPQLAPSSVAKVALESFGALAILYKTFSFDPAGVRLVQRCHGDDRTSRTPSSSSRAPPLGLRKVVVVVAPPPTPRIEKSSSSRGHPPLGLRQGVVVVLEGLPEGSCATRA